MKYRRFSKYSALSEKKGDPISDFSAPPRNILLSSTYGEVNNEVTYDSSNENYKDIESTYSADKNEENKDKENKWKHEKTKVNEEAVPNRDNNKDKISLLFSTIKRGRLTTGEKLPS